MSRSALACVCLALALVGCQTPRDRLAPPAEFSLDPAADTARARVLFEPASRETASVQRALELALLAAASHEEQSGQIVSSEARVDRLCLALRCSIWLVRFAEIEELREAEAERAVVLGNTVCELADDRAEAFYLRAVATGLYAERNTLSGQDAMSRIQADARRAVRLDPEIDDGGPHRVLGGLYLRAPGPPAGVGSLRRAERELQKAYDLAPGHAENLLFLAELKLEQGADRSEIVDLLARVETQVSTVLDRAERQELSRWEQELRSRLDN